MVGDALLNEQIAYYRAIAPEYDDHGIDAPGQRELRAAFDRFASSDHVLGGHILELACGPGHWTKQLLDGASSVTAVDASPEMIERARSQLAEAGVDEARVTSADGT